MADRAGTAPPAPPAPPAPRRSVANDAGGQTQLGDQLVVEHRQAARRHRADGQLPLAGRADLADASGRRGRRRGARRPGPRPAHRHGAARARSSAGPSSAASSALGDQLRHHAPGLVTILVPAGRRIARNHRNTAARPCQWRAVARPCQWRGAADIVRSRMSDRPPLIGLTGRRKRGADVANFPAASGLSTWTSTSTTTPGPSPRPAGCRCTCRCTSTRPTTSAASTACCCRAAPTSILRCTARAPETDFYPPEPPRDRARARLHRRGDGRRASPCSASVAVCSCSTCGPAARCTSTCPPTPATTCRRTTASTS